MSNIVWLPTFVMKRFPLLPYPLLTGAQSAEVLGGLGYDLRSGQPEMGGLQEDDSVPSLYYDLGQTQMTGVKLLCTYKLEDDTALLPIGDGNVEVDSGSTCKVRTWSGHSHPYWKDGNAHPSWHLPWSMRTVARLQRFTD